MIRTRQASITSHGKYINGFFHDLLVFQHLDKHGAPTDIRTVGLFTQYHLRYIVDQCLILFRMNNPERCTLLCIKFSINLPSSQFYCAIFGFQFNKS